MAFDIQMYFYLFFILDSFTSLHVMFYQCCQSIYSFKIKKSLKSHKVFCIFYFTGSGNTCNTAASW